MTFLFSILVTDNELHYSTNSKGFTLLSLLVKWDCPVAAGRLCWHNRAAFVRTSTQI